MEGREPHSVSLRVLRLSRPELAQQQPLPASSLVDPRGSLNVPSSSIDDTFALSPALTLPEAFSSCFIGEAFDCIISVNNELSDSTSSTPAPSGGGGAGGSGGSRRGITSARISAELQTPSQAAVPLSLTPENEAAAKSGIPIGASIQATCHFDLREEGPHVLCITVMYNESIRARQDAAGAAGAAAATTATATGGGAAVSGGRVRSFRKLYNFSVVPCLSVRTKATRLATADEQGDDKDNDNDNDGRAPSSKDGAQQQQQQPPSPSSPLHQYALECQVENLAESTITIERLVFDPSAPFESLSINWDSEHVVTPVLAPREVEQVAFLLKEQPPPPPSSSLAEGSGGGKKETTKDGRYILGALTIHWRSTFGQLGVLSTGWLTTRRP